MIVGVPKEIKNNENRVSIPPAGVYSLVKAGHQVIVENAAGMGSGFTDTEYKDAGASFGSADEVFAHADLIVKVKEYIPSEYKYLREDQMVFTYLHIANDMPLARALLESRTTGIAYETVRGAKGGLPLLAPMSEIAGRMATQVGAYMLQKYNGGRGVLLAGVPGVLPARVVVAGGGVVGFNAARIARGMGADVTIFDVSIPRMAYIDEVTNGAIHTCYNTEYALKEAVKDADLVIGAVLIPGAKAPKVVTSEMVQSMKPGSVIVDVAIDQGGCVATTHMATTHDKPCFEKYGVIHYSVANMPGAVSRTSALALSNATLPYILKLADKGVEALKEDPYFRAGLNTYQGKVTFKGVADALDMVYITPEQALGI